MDANTKPVDNSPVSGPDEELTSALERVRRRYGDNLASFFEKLRSEKQGEASLFDWEETQSTYPAEALARCARK